ncbi:MAG: hypothetical protein R8M11_01370 [Gallionella sp.]
MTTIFSTKWAGILMTLLLIYGAMSNQASSAEIIDDISIKTNSNGDVEALIRFTVPIEQIKFFPKRKSEFIVIHFNFQETVPVRRWRNYDLRRTPTSDVIREFRISTRDLRTGPKIEVKFDRAVEYTLSAGSSGRSLLLRIRANKTKSVQAPKPVLPIAVPSIAPVVAAHIAEAPIVEAPPAGVWDISGQASTEIRYFPYAPAFPNQREMTVSPSFSLEQEIVYEWADNNNLMIMSPFFRVDANDKKRTHFDLREFNWLHLGSNWDLSVGLGKVFWGVTESAHLVDIINQTDAVEDISGEEKLGQPMINFNIEQSWGVANLFILPGFRTRTFTADDARLHGPLAIDTENPIFESSKGERHIDWAARWSRSFGDIDVALSHFRGTSREALLLQQNIGGQTVLVPKYNQIAQTGLELQLTSEATLWKAELMSRTGHGDRFYAGAAGFEHTLYGVAGSIADVGLLVEYLYDGRDPIFAPPSPADNDVFAGFRIAMNDTQDTAVLFGGSWDHKTDAGFINLEAERRLTDQLKLELKGRFFVNIPDSDPITFIRNDDFLELTLNWYF